MNKLFAAVVVFSLSANSQTIFTCKEDQSTTIGWDYGGWFHKEGMKAEATANSVNPIGIVFIIESKKAIIKGNNGQSDLIKLSSTSFLEQNQMGDFFLWTLLPAAKDSKIPSYLFQHKTYQLGGPFSLTVAYKCE
jgi:hypothetical protein